MPKKKSRKKTQNSNPQKILRTVQEVASRYGVSPRVIREQWPTDPNFPGRTGDHGKRNGFFPIGKINAWLLKRESLRRGGRPSKAALVASQELGIDFVEQNSDREKLLGVEAKRAELKLRRELSQVISRDQAEKLIQKQHETAVRSLSPLVEKLVKILPPETPKVLQQAFKSQVEQAISEAADAIDPAYLKTILEGSK